MISASRTAARVVGTIPSALAREEYEAAAVTGEDSPEKEERDGATSNSDAPSGIEISPSEGMISVSDVVVDCGRDGKDLPTWNFFLAIGHYDIVRWPFSMDSTAIS